MLIGIFALNACSNIDERLVYQSLEPTSFLNKELFLSEDDGMNVLYDICAKDSQFYCLDFFNDTILRVFSVDSSSQLMHYALKGNGPDDLLLPVFDVASSLENSKVKMLDVNLWRIKEVNVGLDKNKRLLRMDSAYLLPAIPAVREFSITENNLYGIDVDMKHGAFFIYNRNNGYLKVSEHCLDVDDYSSRYSNAVIPFLLDGSLIVNEKENTVCYAMKNLNIISFYDTKGELRNTVVLGKQLFFPSSDSEFLDFPDSPKYITSMSGTKDDLYCLYHGFVGDTGKSCLLRFNWNGKLKDVIQLDVKLEKISVTPNGKYIYGTMMTEEGGTDVVRFNLLKWDDD